MKSRSVLAVFALAIAGGGCTNLGASLGYTFEPRGDANAQGAPRTETPLYARDGSVIDGAGATGDKLAPRELAPSETGRTYILELYQKAIDERDSLRRELDTLSADLADVKAKVAQGETQANALQARIDALEAENKRRVEENIDLAARLVTAQIRRLQAEKVLLEGRLAQQKTLAVQVPERK